MSGSQRRIFAVFLAGGLFFLFQGSSAFLSRPRWIVEPKRSFVTGKNTNQLLDPCELKIESRGWSSHLKTSHWDDDSLATVHYLEEDPSISPLYIVRIGTHGVHSVESPSTGLNAILAFQSRKGCARFVSRLKRSIHFTSNCPDSLSITRMNRRDLKVFCDSSGILCQVVPSNMDLIPPTRTKEYLSYSDGPGRASATFKRELEHLYSAYTGVEDGFTFTVDTWA